MSGDISRNTSNDNSSRSDQSFHASTSALLTVDDALGKNSHEGTIKISSTAGAALDVLKDILEGFDTLPCVKYIAGIGVKILQIVDVGL